MELVLPMLMILLTIVSLSAAAILGVVRFVYLRCSKRKEIVDPGSVVGSSGLLNDAIDSSALDQRHKNRLWISRFMMIGIISMVILAVVFIGLLLLMMANMEAWEKPVSQENLVGTYTREHSVAKEVIVIQGDGTFTQNVLVNGTPNWYRIKGTWTYKPKTLTLSKYFDVKNGWGDLRTSYYYPISSVNFSVEGFLGKESIGFSRFKNILYRKVNNQEQVETVPESIIDTPPPGRVLICKVYIPTEAPGVLHLSRNDFTLSSFKYKSFIVFPVSVGDDLAISAGRDINCEASLWEVNNISDGKLTEISAESFDKLEKTQITPVQIFSSKNTFITLTLMPDGTLKEWESPPGKTYKTKPEKPK